MESIPASFRDPFDSEAGTMQEISNYGSFVNKFSTPSITLLPKSARPLITRIEETSLDETDRSDSCNCKLDDLDELKNINKTQYAIFDKLITEPTSKRM